MKNIPAPDVLQKKAGVCQTVWDWSHGLEAHSLQGPGSTHGLPPEEGQSVRRAIWPTGGEHYPEGLGKAWVGAVL